MPTIGWDETKPADADGAYTAASALRSLKSNIAGGLSTAIYWPGTGGSSAASAGLPLPGVWRAFYGVESLVSTYADGALYITSDTSRLFGVGSGGTMLLGSSRMIEYATAPSSPKNHWVLSSGTLSPGASFSAGNVILSYYSANTLGFPIIETLSGGNATVKVYNLAGFPIVNGHDVVYWQSIAEVAL